MPRSLHATKPTPRPATTELQDTISARAAIQFFTGISENQEGALPFYFSFFERQLARGNKTKRNLKV